MKKATVYILALVMLLGCLAGCMRNDPVEVYPTPTPVTTTTPDATARPTHNPNQNNNDGMVNDGNGIIEDNDGNGSTVDRNDNVLENDILDNILPDDNNGSGTVTTPNTGSATGANAGGRARAGK